MDLYLFVVIVLFATAVSDLIVGVANDAVNFLNSAVGSRAAPRWIIMTVASVGIFLGVLFSSGMMEVARKGIFNPEMFIMPEILVIFLAVMLTDVMLLDLYNTFGLPTSTTVSLISELLGASVAVSLVKIYRAGHNISEIMNYINTAKVLAIFSAIFISIVVALTMGSLVQYFSRMVFTFDFQKLLKRYGGIYGGIALSFIAYFILIKGAKGASFVTPETLHWLQTHTGLLLLMNFVFWAIVFQLLLLFTKVNILKIIVLVGTGALAMSFAANDLVNFIGAPMAGFSAFRIAAKSAGDPLTMNMAPLAGPVQTETGFLILAGFIMIVTLWFSRKAQTVTRTEVGLGRQGVEGDEQFGSSYLARVVVSMGLALSGMITRIIPSGLQKWISKRFDHSETHKKYKNPADRPAFDLLRASVNLTVASALISFATSLKLPLSTTYVTFMVAMGSSLSDRAWGRESAVYRVTGVLTVVGGWFVTAFLASTSALVMAFLIYIFHLPAIIIFISIAFFFIYRTHVVHKRREKERTAIDWDFPLVAQNAPKIFSQLQKDLASYVGLLKESNKMTFEGILKHSGKILKKAERQLKSVSSHTGKLVGKLMSILQLQEAEGVMEIDPRLFSPIRESDRLVRQIHEVCSQHVHNHHSPLTSQQRDEIAKIEQYLDSLFAEARTALQNVDEKSSKKIRAKNNDFLDSIQSLEKKEIKRIRRGESKTSRQSLLYLNLLSHSEALSNQIVDLIYGFQNSVRPNA